MKKCKHREDQGIFACWHTGWKENRIYSNINKRCVFLCDTLLGAGMQNSLKPVCQRHGRSQKADKSGMLSSALGHSSESRGMGRGEQVNWMIQKHPWRGWGFMFRLKEHKRSVGRAPGICLSLPPHTEVISKHYHSYIFLSCELWELKAQVSQLVQRTLY